MNKVAALMFLCTLPAGAQFFGGGKAVSCPTNQYVIGTTTNGIVCALVSNSQIIAAIGFTPAPIASPTFTGTVGGITKGMVGLGNVDNTADTAKPVSTAQQTALNLKANLTSNTFTGAQVIGTTVLDPVLGPIPIADWCVSSVFGDDANDGKCDTYGSRPFRTIAKLLAQTITAGQSIALFAGSQWRETLTVPANNVNVFGWGQGAIPLLDASDLIPAANWTKTGGLTNVYQAAVTTQSTAAASYVNVFENGAFLLLATSAANCDATAGSFYYPAGTNGAITIQVHASGDSNPATNGKTYEFSSRTNAYDSTSVTGASLTWVASRRPLSTSGSLKLGHGAIVSRAQANQGNLHNIYAYAGGIISDTLMSEAYCGATCGTLAFIAYEQGPGTGLAAASCVNCTVSFTSASPFGVSMGAYDAHTGDGSKYATVDFLGCYATGVTLGFSAASANTNQLRVLASSKRRSYVQLRDGFSAGYGVQGPTNTIIDGLDVQDGIGSTNSRAAIILVSASTYTINSLTLTSANVTSYGVDSGYQFTPNVTITNSTFTGVGNPVWMGRPGTLSINHNTFSNTRTRNYYIEDGATVLASDFNNFTGSTSKPFLFSTSYASYTLWKSGTGQDAHSTP